MKRVRKELGGLSQTAFAQGIGETRATIAGIETGRSNLTFPQLQSVLKTYNVNPVYLLTGDGEIFLHSNKYTSVADPLHVSDIKSTYGRKGTELVTIKAQAGYSEGTQTRDDLPVVRIPGLQDNNARVFEVAGDSMYPLLNHGDFIACKKIASEHEITDGRLYVVVARNHGVSVKYVNRTADALRCTPQNTTEYSAYKVPLDEVLELWEVQIRITRNILNNIVETAPVRLQARFERLEKVLEHLLEAQESQK